MSPEIAKPYISQLLDISEEEAQSLLDGNQQLSDAQINKLAGLVNISEADISKADISEDIKIPERINIKTYKQAIKTVKESETLKNALNQKPD